MVIFELQLFFREHAWHWAVAFGCLFLSPFLVTHLNGPSLTPITMGDFVLASVTQQFYTLVLVPSLFLLVVVDVGVRSITRGAITYIVSRASSRFEWFIAKVATIFIASLVFSIAALVLSVVDALLAGTSWRTELTTHGVLYIHDFTLGLWAAMTLWVVTLFALGLVIFALSLYSGSTEWPWLMGILWGILSYIFLMTHNTTFRWMVPGQMLLLAHVPNRIIQPFNGFSLVWSYLYGMALILIAVVLGGWRAITMNLTTTK